MAQRLPRLLLFCLTLSACSPAPRRDASSPQGLSQEERETTPKNGASQSPSQALQSIEGWLGQEYGVEHRNQRMELVDGWLGATISEIEAILPRLGEGELVTLCKARRSVAPGAEQRFAVLRRVDERYHVWRVMALEHTLAARAALEIKPGSAED